MKYTLSICWSAHSLAVSSISYANLQNLLETSPCVEWWRNLGGSRGLSRHISETSEFWIQLQSSLHIRHLKHINKLRERDGPQSSIRVGRFLPWGVECFQVGNEQVSPFACVITLGRHLTYADVFSFLTGQQITVPYFILHREELEQPHYFASNQVLLWSAFCSKITGIFENFSIEQSTCRVLKTKSTLRGDAPQLRKVIDKPRVSTLIDAE